ncbi:NAD(P)/FAD-dependent oxidoreductase [Halobacillus mangrovi]|uniref:NAD(FAD)-utilizing dehydrogenase n=1 Tax=Halobacillus mangrovi TaxID=402384 RepID=A0A1W6A105_9BACI|nr:NAD(FAD)-utilizing dehydrogenase [Halobacillus mangrovi]ARI79177.1 NAD(FAD)-utilizing dehydrogenase [Halobacillus mangrovi]
MNDVTIIGAGVSGIFLAYTLLKEDDNLNIHIIDKGKKLSQRQCRREQGEPCSCKGACDKYIGFAGLGMSEGKFNYTNDFGGELGRKIGSEETLHYMKKVDSILCSFGGHERKKYSTKNINLANKAATHSLEVLSTETRHLGTVLAKKIFQLMYEYMETSINFTFETEIHSIRKDKYFHIETNNGTFVSRRVVIATGKSGSEWLNRQAQALGLNQGETRLDLGLRVEMRGNQLDSILDQTFETKLRYESDTYSATTYCMNPHGRIIRKYQHGLVMADGQNQQEGHTLSRNLNFTLFVPQYFPTYEKAMNQAKEIIGRINQKRERLVVQRLKDLKNRKVTKHISEGGILPTLKADAGNLYDEMPEFYIHTALKFLTKLEGLLGESVDEDTLLYGLDAKFYEPKLFTDDSFQSHLPGFYLVGDCSGETHSLSQAAASGVYLGEAISRNI